MSDVLAGHRAAGALDPPFWSVAARDADPVVLLLLSRFARQEAVEIVYMGVAQVSRGTGVAADEVRRAVKAARQFSAKPLALSLDRRHTPARKPDAM